MFFSLLWPTLDEKRLREGWLSCGSQPIMVGKVWLWEHEAISHIPVVNRKETETNASFRSTHSFPFPPSYLVCRITACGMTTHGDLRPSVKSFWKLHHKHTQRHVSYMILNPSKLTLQIMSQGIWRLSVGSIGCWNWTTEVTQARSKLVCSWNAEESQVGTEGYKGADWCLW